MALHIPFLEHLAARINEFDQDAVASAGICCGVVLCARGFAVAKPSFVISGSIWCGIWAFSSWARCAPKQWAPAAALVAAALAVEVFHLLYPTFVFLVGCCVGGVSVFLVAQRFEGSRDPASFLGFTVLSSIFMGLSFKHYHEMCWRMLTPAVGGFLAAASLRYYSTALLGLPPAKWLDFTQDIRAGDEAFLAPCGAIFASSWAVATLVGWYCQLAQFLGGQDPLQLPEWAARQFRQVEAALPCFFDVQKRRSKLSLAISRSSSEPLLDTRGENAEEQDGSGKDYRPEVAVVVAIASVLVLNLMLFDQPALFLGHVILMSVAFLPLLTAGMMSYASPNLLLPHLFSPTRGRRLSRHFTHGAFNGLAMVCAIGGYACIYCSHEQTHSSQIGLEPNGSWSRTIHVWNGYFVLFLMCGQACTGVTKLWARVTSSTLSGRLWFHGKMGRVIYSLATVNQLLGYTFRGLMPWWGTLLLAAMLVGTASATLFYLDSRDHALSNTYQNPVLKPLPGVYDEPAEYVEDATTLGSIYSAGHLPTVTERLHSLRHIKNISIGTPSSASVASGEVTSRSSTKQTQAYPIDRLLQAFSKKDNRALILSVFNTWHRWVQAKQLCDADQALQASERLVEFVSQELVEDVYRADSGAAELPYSTPSKPLPPSMLGA